MSNLVKRTKEMYSKIDELMDRYMSVSGINSIATMSDDEALLFRDCLKLIEEAKQYSLELAEILDKLDKINSIDEKLDRLLLMNKN